MTHAELIAALEAATGPSRELDGEIAQLIKPHLRAWRRGVKEASAEADFWFGTQHYSSPAYTSSIDTALTLVPGDLDWALGSSRGVPTYNAFLFQRDDNSTHAGEAYHAKTPATALCAAALKSRKGKDGP